MKLPGPRPPAIILAAAGTLIAIKEIWPAYMDGTRTLPDGAADLIRALTRPR